MYKILCLFLFWQFLFYASPFFQFMSSWRTSCSNCHVPENIFILSSPRTQLSQVHLFLISFSPINFKPVAFFLKRNVNFDWVSMVRLFSTYSPNSSGQFPTFALLNKLWSVSFHLHPSLFISSLHIILKPMPNIFIHTYVSMHL